VFFLDKRLLDKGLWDEGLLDKGWKDKRLIVNTKHAIARNDAWKRKSPERFIFQGFFFVFYPFSNSPSSQSPLSKKSNKKTIFS
jgi:hypothetical protein